MANPTRATTANKQPNNILCMSHTHRHRHTSRQVESLGVVASLLQCQRRQQVRPSQASQASSNWRPLRPKATTIAIFVREKPKFVFKLEPQNDWHFLEKLHFTAATRLAIVVSVYCLSPLAQFRGQSIFQFKPTTWAHLSTLWQVSWATKLMVWNKHTTTTKVDWEQLCVCVRVAESPREQTASYVTHSHNCRNFSLLPHSWNCGLSLVRERETIDFGFLLRIESWEWELRGNKSFGLCKFNVCVRQK